MISLRGILVSGWRYFLGKARYLYREWRVRAWIETEGADEG